MSVLSDTMGTIRAVLDEAALSYQNLLMDEAPESSPGAKGELLGSLLLIIGGICDDYDKKAPKRAQTEESKLRLG